MRLQALAAALSAWMLAGAPLHSAAPVLRSADVTLTMSSPASCDVTMALTVDGAEQVEHRIDSSLVELVGVTGAQTVGDIRVIGRTQSLILRPLQPTYQIQYHALLPKAREFRCPLWLPTIPTDGQSRAIALHVAIPTGAVPSDSMPMLTWSAGRGEATIGHLPAFVHVPFTPDGVAGGWSLAQRMDALTIAVIVGASLFLGLVEEKIIVGFGWSFYGFFAAAAIWMVLYFAWAFAVRDSERPRQR